MTKTIPANKNLWIPYYLMSCYLYYEKDKNVLSDGDFDKLCKMILDNWNDIEHVHKYLISKDALHAGSGYDIVYTNMIKGAAESWYKKSTQYTNNHTTQYTKNTTKKRKSLWKI